MKAITRDEFLDEASKENGRISALLRKSLPSHFLEFTYDEVSQSFTPKKIIGKVDLRVEEGKAFVAVIRGCGESD